MSARCARLASRPRGRLRSAGASASSPTATPVVHYVERMDILVAYLMLALLAVIVALTLYWVIRKAVAAGIRDSQVDEERRQTTRLK